MIELRLPGAHVLFTGRDEGDIRDHAPAAALAGFAGRPLARGRQLHGTVVRTVASRAPSEAGSDDVDDGLPADGQVTAGDAVAPTVLVADCLPIAIAGAGAVAMVHAGWRGLADGIVEQGVAAVRALAAHTPKAGPPGPLVAAIGPGAGPCCYVVGDELRQRFGTNEPTLDLKAIACRLLRDAAVEAIEDVAVCTICDERYFSFRRDGEAAGRQAGVAWLTT